MQNHIDQARYLDCLYAQIKQEKGKLDTIFANAGGAGFLSLGYNETFGTNVIFTVLRHSRARWPSRGDAS